MYAGKVSTTLFVGERPITLSGADIQAISDLGVQLQMTNKVGQLQNGQRVKGVSVTMSSPHLERLEAGETLFRGALPRKAIVFSLVQDS